MGRGGHAVPRKALSMHGDTEAGEGQGLGA